jgi:NTP pyrophosphatase (non-canonical NTP hydrolase)
MNLRVLQQQLRRFSEERDWERFHSPKNLSMALSVEAAELLEHFQWLTEDQSASLASTEREDVAAEIADVQIYLTMLADKLGIDIESAVSAKLESNAVKYPAAHRRHGQE